MALITFMSDFGDSDHYVAAVKAKIYSIDPTLKLIDISHQIEACNIAHGSFVLKSVFKEFPAGTIHLATVNTSVQGSYELIAIKLEDHYFVGSNNGLFSLISDSEPTEAITLHWDNEKGSFPEKDILAEAAGKLAQGISLNELGDPVTNLQRMLNKKSRATKQKISGHVIHVDHFGNLITNIEYNDFSILSKNRKYKIIYGRTSTGEIHNAYSSVVHGECFTIFNSLGLLEIGIYMGNGSELLGLNYDSPVNIIFED
ncbi:SAM-dependent chlorinase/fluorinase [Fulvivirgaceae bacterium BMA10]|uniref:SAM-dependent chlorinase/fluorinase n=1 Tax=Splendidivirga corallicola TaxID=3051826 RepID=A0ABT8KJC7_9BACT|nr:SAM-dependent chlorinase/fluorinase [Fulvivirgaceae bacterium BMA10]